ncbi:MAG: glycosyltransferase family 4 protein [Candidatus Humimicrobiia bacterium]
MKILHVIPYFTPKRGGDVNVCYNLSKHLIKKSHEVTIITTDFEFDEEYAKSIEGVNVIQFKCVANCGLFLYSPSMKKWLRDNVKNFDVVHLHNFRSYQNNVVYKYAKKYRIPYILQAHGSSLRIIEKQRLKKLYDWVWGYKILKDSSKLIAVSKVEVEQYKKIGVDDNKIVLIPNGLDVERFKNLPKHGQFREKHGIKENHIILFLGRIHKIKGVDFLIKAFGSLVKEMDNVILVIAGPDDGYRKECEKLTKDLNLRDRVKFIGCVDNVAETYQDTDVLIYPSIYEIFGLVPFEAIMCGTPVIVTDDCGCSELVKEAGCGYLVEYGDVNDLEEKIKYLLKNPEEGTKMVKRGKRYVEENLTWDKVVKKVEEVYESCIP